MFLWDKYFYYGRLRRIFWEYIDRWNVFLLGDRVVYCYSLLSKIVLGFGLICSIIKGIKRERKYLNKIDIILRKVIIGKYKKMIKILLLYIICKFLFIFNYIK